MTHLSFEATQSSSSRSFCIRWERFCCNPIILTIFMALMRELVAAIRLCVAVFQAFWRGCKCFATNRLMCEHTTQLNIYSEDLGGILTINQKKRKRPDPANFNSQKSYTYKNFNDLSPCFVNHFGNSIEAICIRTYECGGLAVVISDTGRLHGLGMNNPHEGTSSNKLQSVYTVSVHSR